MYSFNNNFSVLLLGHHNGLNTKNISQNTKPLPRIAEQKEPHKRNSNCDKVHVNIAQSVLTNYSSKPD